VKRDADFFGVGNIFGGEVPAFDGPSLPLRHAVEGRDIPPESQGERSIRRGGSRRGDSRSPGWRRGTEEGTTSKRGRVTVRGTSPKNRRLVGGAGGVMDMGGAACGERIPLVLEGSRPSREPAVFKGGMFPTPKKSLFACHG
jgi:hypothetical protein